MRNFGHVMVNAILCSGEMNTSFKNGATMRTMVKYATYDIAKTKFSFSKESGELKKLVNLTMSKHEGDDSIAVHPQGCRPDTDWWVKNGWVIKVEFIGKASEASFCGLVFDDFDLVSVPDIRATLAKFGWTSRNYARSGHGCLMSLLRAKALSLACEYGNVPILGPFAHRLLFLTKHVTIRKSVIQQMDAYSRAKFVDLIKTKAWMIPPDIRSGTRALVDRLQGITPNLQLKMEHHLSTIGLGSFSLPGLDFSPSTIHNMSRCHSNVEVPRCLNIASRKLLCSYINNKFQSEISLSPSKMRYMSETMIHLGLGHY